MRRPSEKMTLPKVCERVNILGVGVSVINRQSAVRLFFEALEQRRTGYITVTGAHGVMEAQKDEHLRAILNQSFLCTPDGMPMVWLGRLGGYREIARVYGPDFMLDVCEASRARGVRHFFYGGAKGVASDLKEKLSARFPGLIVAGIFEPPFRPLNPDEEAALRHAVQETRPDVMWVGLSTPKQERFMAEYISKLDVTMMVGVGAAFDFHTGRVKQAPDWMQAVGLEWFYRLCQEPRRLWKRYLTTNPKFVYLIFCQYLGLRKTRSLES
jgi:N-acetylglucosaminyldiphosphoundecaprenol N-acetyl-beta-D-mannosaminyltransferase